MSVSIVHQFKTLKLKVTPGTSSTEILTKATDHFKLDFATTGLFHNSTELELDIPFRLLNLPAGAKLTLNPSKRKKSSIVNIKVQLVNSPFEKTSIVKKFDSTLSIKDVVKDVENTLKVAILEQNYGLKFHSMLKVISEDDVSDVTLNELGVGNNGVLRISFTTPYIINFKDDDDLELVDQKIKDVITDKKPNTENASDKVEDIVVDKPDDDVQVITDHKSSQEVDHSQKKDLVKDQEQHTEPEPAPTPEPKQHVYVFKPASEPVSKAVTEESAYEVTVDQARQYQNILSQRAHDTPKLRRLREASKKPIEIKSIEIRIKFPDGANLQANFLPTDTNLDLYNFVKGTLQNEDESFELVIPYPLKHLSISNEKLVDNLSARNLLVFNSNRKTGSFLKKEYLASALDITEAPEVKLDLNRHLLEDETSEVSDGKIHNGLLPKRKEIPQPSSSSASTKDGKKIPKWLKIGKK